MFRQQTLLHVDLTVTIQLVVLSSLSCSVTISFKFKPDQLSFFMLEYLDMNTIDRSK